MHLAERMRLPAPYCTRPYRGAVDHQAMTAVLAAYREYAGDEEMPTIAQLDATYTNLTDCDPATDIAIIEVDGDVVGYSRVSYSDFVDGGRVCVVFAPITPSHLEERLFKDLVCGQELHMRRWIDGSKPTKSMAYASHPGPDQPPSGGAAWLEDLGYVACQWGASLVRPHLDNIPERALPAEVEVRPVEPDQIRRIWEEHHEAFRGEWDFEEPTAELIDAMLAEPYADPTLWKVAWAGDEIVGQVKSFINPEENEAHGYRRGYTEYISTHRDWRNRGIAGALLALSLHELKGRGMTEAALGVDTNNPGGAFQLYTGMGFALRNYEAVYTKPIE